MMNENTLTPEDNKNIFTKDDIESVSLLSMDEYKKNRDLIPVVKCWWWINSPGIYKKNAMYIFIDGEIYTEGYKVDSDRAGIRPVFRLKPEAAHGLKLGEKVIIGKYSATVLDNDSCLLDDVVCNHRFDIASNNWEKSELKSFIESEEFMNMIWDIQTV